MHLCSYGGGLGKRYLYVHLLYISKLIVPVKMGVLGSIVLWTGNCKQRNCGRFFCALMYFSSSFPRHSHLFNLPSSVLVDALFDLAVDM